MNRKPDPKVTFSVSQLTSLLKETLETVFSDVRVQGEVSGLKASAQGHYYFTLKDQTACISCVIWRSKALFLPFRPKDGDTVIVHGQLSVFEARGSYQIVCSSIENIGVGSILMELEQRKRRYQAEGLFDESRKRPIPNRPGRVGIITSPTGAALRDIMNVLSRRSSGVDLIVLPAVVQGTDAAPQIARRIRQANEFCVADVLIVGRGGGSIEDLLPFSDDSVVRAVAESEIPVISAVGHEIDWALCDFAADLRAPTPSAAAELVSASQSDLVQRISDLKKSMTLMVEARITGVRLVASRFSVAAVWLKMLNRLTGLRMTADEQVNRMKKLVDSRMQGSRVRLDRDTDAGRHLITSVLGRYRLRMEKAQDQLDALSPLAVLDRGYSITLGSDGKVIKSARTLKNGVGFTLRLSDGTVSAISNGEIKDER